MTRNGKHQKLDSLQRDIALGDIVFWRGRLCVIRGFGKTDLPHVTYRVTYYGHNPMDVNDCIRIPSEGLIKIEDAWLMTFPNQDDIRELMRIRHEVFTKENVQKSKKD